MLFFLIPLWLDCLWGQKILVCDWRMGSPNHLSWPCHYAYMQINLPFGLWKKCVPINSWAHYDSRERVVRIQCSWAVIRVGIYQSLHGNTTWHKVWFHVGHHGHIHLSVVLTSILLLILLSSAVRGDLPPPSCILVVSVCRQRRTLLKDRDATKRWFQLQDWVADVIHHRVLLHFNSQLRVPICQVQVKDFHIFTLSGYTPNVARFITNFLTLASCKEYNNFF